MLHISSAKILDADKARICVNGWCRQVAGVTDRCGSTQVLPGAGVADTIVSWTNSDKLTQENGRIEPSEDGGHKQTMNTNRTWK